MTFLSRIMGLLREMTKAAFLGTSAYADAFGIAFMIPNLFRRLFAENSISVAFIPTFRGYLEDDRDAGTHAAIQLFISSTLTLVSFLTAIVTVLGILAAPLIVPIFYGRGADADILAETAFLTRIMFPYLFVISAAAFLQGILNGCNSFAPSGFTPVLFNGIVVAVTYFLTPQLPNPEHLPQEALAARAMAFGVLTGGCFQALFQWPFVRKTGWKTTLTGLRNAFTNPGTRKVVALIVPTIIGMAAYQLNDLVSTAIAGKTGTGTVSSLQYSLRLQELILGIFAVSIGTVILPDLSGLAKNQKWREFNEMLVQAIKIIALITIPVTFYSLVSGRELISLVYKTKNFDDRSVALTLSVFRFHIAGLFFIAANRVISPAFYAQGNTKLPTLAGIICFGANIALAFLLSFPMKGNGIALALTLASFVNTACLFLFMRKMPSMDMRGIAKKMLGCVVRTTCFSIIAAAPAFFVRQLLVRAAAGRGRLLAYGIPVLGTAAVFAAVGIALLVLFRDETAAAVSAKLRGKFRRKA
ncbi:MAG: murein biosynthesis integral membrane protein MurJ [Treponemataceae bacterium]|nr:murein biosynthesis integral membrane protein MurJ [Treponemataceae bacterium]